MFWCISRSSKIQILRENCVDFNMINDFLTINANIIQRNVRYIWVQK